VTLLTVAEAAAELHISARTIYDLVHAGRLAHVRIGLGRGAIRFTREDLAAFVAASRVEAEPARTHGSVRRAGTGPRARETHGL
jgi:excisionase family DNA binding protein